MSDEHYLGDTIVWEMEDPDEWRKFMKSRRWEPYSIWALGILTPAVPFAFWGFGIYGVVPLSFLLVQVWRAYVDHKYRTMSVVVRLHPGSIMIVQQFGGPHLLRDRCVEIYRAKRIESAQWITSGLHVSLRRKLFGHASLVLPHKLFELGDGLRALYEWAAHHGITIEGPPPLPGAYARPIE